MSYMVMGTWKNAIIMSVVNGLSLLREPRTIHCWSRWCDTALRSLPLTANLHRSSSEVNYVPLWTHTEHCCSIPALEPVLGPAMFRKRPALTREGVRDNQITFLVFGSSAGESPCNIFPERRPSVLQHPIHFRFLMWIRL